MFFWKTTPLDFRLIPICSDSAYRYNGNSFIG